MTKFKDGLKVVGGYARSMAEMLGKYALSRGVYQATGQPDILLGFIPLYHVQLYEVALSQDELKFRAVGFSYLGDQEGRNTGIRIDFRLIGPMQEVFLSLIEGLYLWCKGRGDINRQFNIAETMNIWTKYSIEGGNRITANLGGTGTTTGGGILNTKSIKPTSFDNYLGQTKTASKSDDYDKLSSKYNDTNLKTVKEEGTTYQHRRSFILMSRTDVIYKMFLQTYIYRRSVANGQNVIDVSVFLRRYDPQKEVDIEFTSDYVFKGQVDITNHVNVEGFLNATKIQYDPNNRISHAKKIERLFYDNKKSFINLEVLTNKQKGDVDYYSNVKSQHYLYGDVEKTNTKVTKIAPKESVIKENSIEFLIKGMHRAYTSSRRIAVDRKVGYLEDRVMLDMGLLNGLFKVTENVGYSNDIITEKLSWVLREV